MKIIQTTVNCIDSQSGVIEININWSMFVQMILDSAKSKTKIKDEDIGVIKSYPLRKGILFPQISWYDINQNDDYHLDVNISIGNYDARIIYTLLENVNGE